MPGDPNAMGGNGQPPPQLPPDVQQNDEVVKSAVKNYLHDTGEGNPEEAAGEEETQGIEESPQEEDNEQQES